MITNDGLTYLLNVALSNGVKYGTWYIGLIHATNYAGLAIGDTLASHIGWEEGNEYAETTRQPWVNGGASGEATGSSTVATFTITQDTTYKGFFLASANTKGGTSGVLLCTALFQGGDQALKAGQQLQVNFQLTAQDASAS
jgi:hypothetical protein